MSYFQARSDLAFMVEFHNTVVELWKYEGKAGESLDQQGHSLSSRAHNPHEIQRAIQSEAGKIEGYEKVRMQVVRGLLRATRIALKLNVPVIFTSHPMPALAGSTPVVNTPCFDCIINDPTYVGVPHRMIFDTMVQTIGECESKVKEEFIHLINPFYWLKELLVFIIRIPFVLIQASGFDVSKVEDQFIGKLFKLVEIVGIVYLAIQFGANNQQIQDLLKSFLLK